jgi:hypothetical protein
MLPGTLLIATEVVTKAPKVPALVPQGLYSPLPGAVDPLALMNSI